jgi:hypothetical protein
MGIDLGFSLCTRNSSPSATERCFPRTQSPNDFCWLEQGRAGQALFHPYHNSRYIRGYLLLLRHADRRPVWLKGPKLWQIFLFQTAPFACGRIASCPTRPSHGIQALTSKV